MNSVRCSPAGCAPRQRRALCPGLLSEDATAAALPERRFSLLGLLSLSGPQLVCDGETPAQSPEHEQYGRTVKGAVPFKRQKARSRHGHCAETKPVTFVCSTDSGRFPIDTSHMTHLADVQDSQWKKKKVLKEELL